MSMRLIRPAVCPHPSSSPRPRKTGQYTFTRESSAPSKAENVYCPIFSELGKRECGGPLRWDGVIRSREAAVAATFDFQRKDATTLRGSGRQRLPRLLHRPWGDRTHQAFKNRMTSATGTTSLRLCVVALKNDWPAVGEERHRMLPPLSGDHG